MNFSSHTLPKTLYESHCSRRVNKFEYARDIEECWAACATVFDSYALKVSTFVPDPISLSRLETYTNAYYDSRFANTESARISARNQCNAILKFLDSLSLGKSEAPKNTATRDPFAPAKPFKPQLVKTV